MRKLALIFILAVFVPSLVLAWLAVRSVKDQQLVLERQQVLLNQAVADRLAENVRQRLDELQADFARQRFLTCPIQVPNAPSQPVLSAPVAGSSSGETNLMSVFDQAICRQWPLAEVGFVVSVDGQMIAPSLFSGPKARQFRLDNDPLLCNRETVEVYWKAPEGINSAAQTDGLSGSVNAVQAGSGSTASKEAPRVADAEGRAPFSKAPSANAVFATKSGAPPPTSPAPPEETEFSRMIAGSERGTLARFFQDRLKLLFWNRPEPDSRVVFGAQIDLDRLVGELAPLVQVESAFADAIHVALLDDNSIPVATSSPGTPMNWRQPLVAAEVGEMLPHWRAAVYLIHPNALARSARAMKLTLGLIITSLVLTIGVGGWLITQDLRRQLALARQKTDFVSNVSHELKTPLTSIRMFSELLAEDRVPESDTRRRYLNIISAESSRLTRLINNVLDFARMDRGETRYQLEPISLNDLVRDVVATQQPHLADAGLSVECFLPEETVTVQGDRDALAQVLLNLLSNAGKYAAQGREVTVRLDANDEHTARVSVMDRGPGVPSGVEDKIFEQFFRAHDTLANGIQGCGLGLTLARQIARAHAGNLDYTGREGGGSCFTLNVPRTRA